MRLKKRVKMHSWVVVNMLDGMIFEGMVKEETSYGLYMYIGGDESRLSLFPWHVVSRVIYKV
jgi:hypothetical protein